MADTGSQSAGSAVNDTAVRDEINKRLTLNWLIQGAAQHAGMTFHQQFPAFDVSPEMQGILIFLFVNAAGKILAWIPQFTPQAKGLAGHGSLCQEGTQGSLR